MEKNIIKEKLKAKLESLKEEIETELGKYDGYLYFVVYDRPNQMGNDWHSYDDCTDSIAWITDDIACDTLTNNRADIKPNEWDNIQSWYLELWENNYNGDDNFIKAWCGNL